MISTTHKNRGGLVKRIILSVALLAALLGGQAVKSWAQDKISIQFNDETVSGASLEACIGQITTSDPIERMTVTAGEFTEADWGKMRFELNRASNPRIKDLKKVVFAEGVTVANTPDAWDADQKSLYFNSKTIERVHFLGTTPKRLGAYTFSNCTKLVEVTLPEGLTEIGENAFHVCTQLKLKNINLPKSVTTIEQFAFNECAALTEIVIPDGVTTINDNAFSGCSSLEKVTLPKGLTEFGWNAFDGCTALKEIVIPEGVKEMSSSIFANCSNLEKVTLPKGLETIGSQNFYECTALKEIIIPENVTSIGMQAFVGCSALKEITCMIDEPLTLDEDNAIFYGVTDCKLYVPHKSEQKYKEALVWKDLDVVGSFNVTFEFIDADNKSEPLTQLSKGDKIGTMPEAPTRQGYAFAGWTKTKDGKTVDFDENTTIEDDLTVYPVWEASACTVTFFTDATTEWKKVKVAQNNAVGFHMPEAPTRDEYIFKGWMTTKTGDTPDFDKETVVEKDMEVYAVWKPSVTITFMNNDNEYKKITIEQNTTIGINEMPEEPTQDEKTFKGWNTDENGKGDEFTGETVVKETMKVYAVWDTKKCTITFLDYDGNVVDTREVDYGGYVDDDDLPKLGKETNRKFKGWSTTQNSTKANFDEYVTITEDLTLYPVWTNIFTVTFHIDGKKEEIQVNENETVGDQEPQPTAPEEGYILKGWNTDKDGNGEDFTKNTQVTKDWTVYPVWELKKITVEFDTKGGSAVDAKTVNWGETLGDNMPENPTCDGKNFIGWTIQEDGDTPDFDANTEVKEDIKVYAIWKPIVLTITFDSKGGSAVDTKTVNWGETLGDNMPEDPTHNDYIFRGWNTDENGNGENFTKDTEVKKDLTVYAIWGDPHNTHTVTFHVDGKIEKVKVGDKETVGSKEPQPTAPKEGYILKGWNTDENGEGDEFTKDTKVTKDWTVYPVWELKKITVEFDTKGGSAVASKTVNWGETLGDNMPEDPTRDDYTFKGWNTDENGEGDEFTKDTEVKKNLTVYAIWENNHNTYTVTFHIDGQTQDIQVGENETVGSKEPHPTAPEGHTLKGWNTDENGEGEEFTKDTKVTKNWTVYPIWELKKITVEFDTKGGSAVASKIINWGETLGDKMPKDPTRKGYKFIGWTTTENAKKADFNEKTAIKDNVKVYAIWEKDQKKPEGKDTKTETPTAVESSLLASVTVGPNPFNESLVIRGIEKAQEYRITSLTGHTLLRGTTHGHSEIRISTESLPTGVYILTLQATDGATTFKLIKR